MMNDIMNKTWNVSKVMCSKMKKQVYKASKGDSFYVATPKSYLTCKNGEHYRVYSLCDVANYLSKEKFAAMVREGFEIMGDGSDLNFVTPDITDENIRALQIHAIRMDDKDETYYFLGRWHVVVIGVRGKYKFSGNYQVGFRRIGGRCRCHVIMSVFDEDMGIDIESESPYTMYAKLRDVVQRIEDQAEALAVLKVSKKATAVVKPRATTRKKVSVPKTISMDELEKACE